MKAARLYLLGTLLMSAQLVASSLALFCPSNACADENTNSIDELIGPRLSSSDYSQLFMVQAAPIHPRSVAVSNGDYNYQYGGDSLSSYLVEAGWAIRLFQLFGSFQFEQNLGFSNVSGTTNIGTHGSDATDKLNVYMVMFDSRLMYSAEWFPWKVLVPFVDGGYQYTLFDQNGRTDLESSQGGFGNFVAGAGIRFWLNRGSINSSTFAYRMTSVPIYLTLKTNWVQANNHDMDLGGRNYMAGLAIAL